MSFSSSVYGFQVILSTFIAYLIIGKKAIFVRRKGKIFFKRAAMLGAAL